LIAKRFDHFAHRHRRFLHRRDERLHFDDIRRLLEAGADKASINTAAVKRR